METPQDGIIVLVVFVEILYQLLTHFLKTDQAGLVQKPQTLQDLKTCTLFVFSISDDENVPLSESHRSSDRPVPVLPASLHT